MSAPCVSIDTFYQWYRVCSFRSFRVPKPGLFEEPRPFLHRVRRPSDVCDLVRLVHGYALCSLLVADELQPVVVNEDARETAGFSVVRDCRLTGEDRDEWEGYRGEREAEKVRNGRGRERGVRGRSYTRTVISYTIR